MTDFPPSAELAVRIVRKLHSQGHTAYFAGGCVRDRLMNRTPNDFDIATSALPEQVLALFPRALKVGAAFGVILIREKHNGHLQQVEVATFRADGSYSDGRHPNSVRFTNAHEDAQRRDFTCNGLFLDPLTDTLHDFVGGQRDIDAKILRAIGNPQDRFAEDHLRMLRALRFAARLEFAIDTETADAITALQKNIASISRERIGEELRMMLAHPNRVRAMELLATFPDLFTIVLGFSPSEESADHDWPTLSGLPAKARRAVTLAAILNDVDPPDSPYAASNLRERLVLSNTETEELIWFSKKIPLLRDWEDLSKSTLKRLIADPRWPDLATLYRADPQNADQMFAFNERIATLEEEGAAPPPYISGAMLISLGASPGPTFKNWLHQLYDRQLEGDFQNADDALAAARQLIAQQDGTTG